MAARPRSRSTPPHRARRPPGARAVDLPRLRTVSLVDVDAIMNRLCPTVGASHSFRPVHLGKSKIVMVPLLAHEDRVLGVEVPAPTSLGSAVLGIVTPGTMMVPRVEDDD